MEIINDIVSKLEGDEYVDILIMSKYGEPACGVLEDVMREYVKRNGFDGISHFINNRFKRKGYFSVKAVWEIPYHVCSENADFIYIIPPYDVEKVNILKSAYPESEIFFC